MTITILLFCIGFFLISKGGDLFTESAIKIARISGLPEIFIGATLVSIATTAPEGIVSITAAAKGHTTMSIGNAFGSIICNTGLILGLTNMIKPGRIKGRFFKVKSIVLLLYFITVTILSYDRQISKGDALILLLLLLGYMVLDGFILKYKRNQASQYNGVSIKLNQKLKIILLFILGISSIIIGSNLLINNGVVLAELLGVPKSVISLSLIAFGTSLPELTTALAALKKGHTSLSIGNLIGANILNIALVVGASGLIAPLKIEKRNLVLDFPVAFIMILILTLPCLLKNKISRIQAFLLLIIYVAFITIMYQIYL